MPPLNKFQRNCINLAVGQALIGSGLGAAILPATGNAATITVNSAIDAPNSANCDLREAIYALYDGALTTAGCTVTGSFGVDDEVNFNLPAQSTITLNGTEIIVSSTVSISGPGADQLTIDANQQSGVFYVYQAGNARIDGLTLTGGASNYDGGAISIYGSPNITISNSTIEGNYSYSSGGALAIFDSESATINNSTISGNSTPINGGGIYLSSADSINISNSTISDNSAPGSGGGIYSVGAVVGTISDVNITNNISEVAGGGIYAVGDDLRIESGIVSNNTAGTGGGISFNGSNINIVNSTISGNQAEYTGGGAVMFASSDVSILSSTIANNQANSGGGLYFFLSDAEIVNSTISGNAASETFSISGYGGGIMTANQSGLSVDLFSTTINDNSALGANAQGGGLFAENAGDIVLSSNNVIANSTGSDCNIVLSSFGINWVEDSTCFGSGDGDPLLGPLQNNGGPTLTHAPLVGSELIDAGDLAACASAPINGLDQRGESRGTTACFIGAVEDVQEEPREEDDLFFVIPLSSGRAVIFSL